MECKHTDPRAYCKRSDGCRDCETDLAQTGEGGRMEEFERWFTDYRGCLDTKAGLRAAWQAATAAERSRCEEAALAEKVDAADSGDASDKAYNLACDHVAAAIRKG